MPLLPAVLESGLQELVDDPPDSEQVAIERHAAVFRAYMEGITNPAVPPPAHDAAEAAFIAAAAGQALSIAFVQAAYSAYVVALAPLSAPFVSIPPAGLPPLTPVPLPAYVVAVDTWVRTGTASVPPAPPVPWA